MDDDELRAVTHSVNESASGWMDEWTIEWESERMNEDLVGAGSAFQAVLHSQSVMYVIAEYFSVFYQHIVNWHTNIKISWLVNQKSFNSRFHN